ncbi:CRR6 family NdhI maturation factor [filamentous cyanobacterium LEGE 11480]|uniref:CRR6 family NdhI maturation factor n=1 Tax=Romeriopsis navalis LEGE 11480 TaxID=2777977 RepID=A0A928VGJ1_9CYAN|nr:CRR6 family NdhI maturation factor [Romeriopsis navalis]MBE9028183.1 CRR6 family NdhI maturation factor [Romeriopsis navalis LEGE 11480]
MTVTIDLSTAQIHRIDITAAAKIIQPLLDDLTANEQQVQFQIDWEREDGDPRELSEIPELRLWFIRLDAEYPWLPFFLDWKAGELARYVAMLVPHQFHPKDGVQFNPEALEIFVMRRVFVLMNWLRAQGIEGRSRIKAMTQMLGYELEDGFFDLLGF